MSVNSPKIALVVCAGVSPVAGHHYSARDLGIAFERSGVTPHHIVIQTPNRKQPAAFLGRPNVETFDISIKQLKALRRLRKYLLKQGFAAILPLDEFSVRLVYSVAPELRQRIFPIKPGGVNSSSWSASLNGLICFSKENFDFFTSHPKYRNTDLHLLPQRVAGLVSRNDVIEAFKTRINYQPGQRIILAGARVCFGSHKDSGKSMVFTSALRLYRELVQVDDQVRLVLAGAPKGEPEANWLHSLAGNDPGITTITDSCFTSQLSQLFFAADFVIGMGRTAMEALSIGKITFVPLNDQLLPIPITKENYTALSHYNFTYRYLSEHKDHCDESVRQTIQKIGSDAGDEDASNVSRELFDTHLNAERAIPEYLKLFSTRAPKAPVRSAVSWSYSYARTLLILLRASRRKAPSQEKAS